MDSNLDYTRYFIWADGHSEYNVRKMLQDVPNKAVIFGAEECELMYDWGRLNQVPISINLTAVLGVANNNFLPHHSIPESTNVILWPTFWMSKTYCDLLPGSHISDNSKIDKLYMSLNYKPRMHRSLLMDELCHHDLMRYGHISWHLSDPDHVWKHWKPTKLLVDTESINQWEVPSTYKSTLFNIIPETTTEMVFITEKTCTAILYKKPFIVLGASGFHRVLKDMGFELYNELFDYSFDTDAKLPNRINGIINNINNLKNQDYEILRQKVKDKVEHNYNKIVELATTRKHVPDFMLQYIDTIKKNPKLITPYDLNYLEIEKLLTQ